MYSVLTSKSVFESKIGKSFPTRIWIPVKYDSLANSTVSVSELNKSVEGIKI